MTGLLAWSGKWNDGQVLYLDPGAIGRSQVRYRLLERWGVSMAHSDWYTGSFLRTEWNMSCRLWNILERLTVSWFVIQATSYAGVEGDVRGSMIAGSNSEWKVTQSKTGQNKATCPFVICIQLHARLHSHPNWGIMTRGAVNRKFPEYCESSPLFR